MAANVQPYSNRDLARDYFGVVAQYSGGLKTYDVQRRRIAESCVDIQSYYIGHNGLDELRIDGIGVKTKRILTLILRNGVEEARKIVEGEKILKMQGRPLRASRKSSVDDYGPSWENVVRAIEDG